MKTRKKLFIGVLATGHELRLDMATWLKTSLLPHADRILFFVNNPDDATPLNTQIIPPSLDVIHLKKESQQKALLPFHVLNFTAENYLKRFDWFFFVDDETFVRGSKVLFHLAVSYLHKK